MGFWEQVWWHVGTSPAGALSVVLATSVLYLVFAGVLHLVGARLMGTPGVLAFCLSAMLASLFARAMLGNSPTMVGALLAVATLLLLEGVLGRIRFAHRSARHAHGARWGRSPVVVVVQGRARPEVLRRRRLGEPEVLARLRTAGLLTPDDAALVILEPRGQLTIVRRGQRIDARLLEGVEGAELVPEELVVHP